MKKKKPVDGHGHSHSDHNHSHGGSGHGHGHSLYDTSDNIHRSSDQIMQGELFKKSFLLVFCSINLCLLDNL